jgi:polar amino acid transport system substrate-binding protein
VTIVADGGNAAYKGLNMSGKTDVAGTPFRDQIVAGALRQGTGWVEYVFMNPAESGLFEKTAYYTLVKGSDGEMYVVCSGTYKPCG